MSRVRIPGPAFYSDMLAINIIGESYSMVKRALVTLFEGLENVMFSVKQVNPGLVWKCIKEQKGKRIIICLRV